MQHRTRTPRFTAVALASALALSACGDDADGTGATDETVAPATEAPVTEAPATTVSATEAPATEASATTASPTPTTADEGDESPVGVLAVEMHDFHYGDLPDEVPAGTRIEVSNVSDSEIHEFVAFRLADDDDRLMADIIGDLEGLLTSGPPAAVLLAPPGGEQIAAVGDGTLSEPGRYVIVCVIPTGADPGEYLAAAAESDGPPDVEGGAPHVMNGMYAELTVTA